MFFPEGTLRRESGLRPFRLGAFVAATGAGIPLIPVAIRGGRAILRDETWLPRCGAVTLTIGTPLKPAGPGWADALALHNAARAHILAHCGEPDLSQ